MFNLDNHLEWVEIHSRVRETTQGVQSSQPSKAV